VREALHQIGPEPGEPGDQLERRVGIRARKQNAQRLVDLGDESVVAFEELASQMLDDPADAAGAPPGTASESLSHQLVWTSPNYATIILS